MTDWAVVGGRLFTDLVDMTSDLAALDSIGTWIIVLPYDSPPLCFRFDSAVSVPSLENHAFGEAWPGVDEGSWQSSLSRVEFIAGVEQIRADIATGDVYQVNLTRRLTAPVRPRASIGGLARVLSRANPAPYSAVVSIPSRDIAIASASPELFLARRGRLVRSSPIKGTAASVNGFLPKDSAENIMIVDLMRNDLGRVCEWGSVVTPAVLSVETHPGLHHLVSTVEGILREDVGWAELVDATFPPGSITGAPKIAATKLISELEPVTRDFYCGAIGWVDAEHHTADLNVAIRTFWISEGQLCFGTGGGITYDSSPEGEWEETELKARTLIAAATRADISGSGSACSDMRAAEPQDRPTRPLADQG